MADIDTLVNLVTTAAEACRDRVMAHLAEKRFVPSHYDFPTAVRQHSTSAMPNVDDSFFSGPPDYSDIFRWSDKPDVGEKVSFYDVPELVDLRDWFIAQPDLIGLVAPQSAATDIDFTADERPEWCDVTDHIIFQLAIEIVDHLGNTVGLDSADEGAIRVLAERLANGFQAERPPVELVAPVLMVRFDVQDSFEMSEDLHLVKMSDDFIREKADSFRGHGLHATLQDCATHALVLSKLELVDNTRWFGTSDARGFISDVIDLAMSCIRLVSDVDTGYSQLIVRGVGWDAGFKADIRRLVRKVPVKAYRDSLEFGWLRPTPFVSGDELAAIRSLISTLRDVDETHHVRVALRRLSAGILRVEEADSLLDYCIGLEALLGDESTTEVTHKLAMRTAAVLAMAGLETEPAVIYRAVKRIYAVRSKVVHGKAGSLGKEIDLGSGLGTTSATRAALEVLRHALITVVGATDIWDPAEIDRVILSKMQLNE